MRSRLALRLALLGSALASLGTDCKKSRQLPPTAASVPSGTTSSARAFRISAAQDLLDGALASGAIGDFRLESDRIVVIVDALERPWGTSKSGGNIRDIAPAGGRDELAQAFLLLNEQYPSLVVYDDAATTANGSSAQLRVRGHDERTPGIAIETTYRVEQGQPWVQISTRITNQTNQPISDFDVGDGVYWGTAQHFAPGHGTHFEGAKILPWVGGRGDDVAYVYGTKTGRPRSVHAVSWANFSPCAQTLAPGASMECQRYIIVGSRADFAGALESLWRLRNQKTGRLQGRFEDIASHLAVDRALIAIATADGKPFATTLTDSQGRYSIALPPGAYRVSVSAPGRSGAQDVAVQVDSDSSTSLSGVLSEPAELAFEVRDEGGALLPAKLTLFGREPTPDPTLGPPHRAAGSGNVALTATGQGKLALSAGRYHVVASHGPEYTISSVDVELAPGRETAGRFELRRVVDTHGYIGADLHQHANPSTDSVVTIEDRVISDLAEGVEVAVATDHEAITDYAPAVASLRARPRLLTIVGDEATTHTIGHFNGFPLTRRPELPRGGAFAAEGLSAAEIFAHLRADPLCRVVQVNHPRVARIGYFAISKFDPTAPKLPEGFAVNFDALEVANGKRMHLVSETLLDWYSLLRRGLRITATGNSDTHRIVADEAGWPRTYVKVPDDDPANLTPEMIATGISQHRDVVVSMGPFLRVNVDGQPPGSSLRARGGRGGSRGIDIDVQVWAAPWVDVTRLEIVVNGETRETIAIAPSEEPLRLDWKKYLSLTEDAFVVVVARGERPLAPVVSGDAYPIAISNPVWVDVDSRPGWNAPGISKPSPNSQR